MARYNNELDDDRERYLRHDRYARERPWNYNDPYERRSRSYDDYPRERFSRGRYGERADYDVDEPRYSGYPEGRGLPELELGVPTWVASVEPLLEAWQALGARVSVQPCTANHPMARDTHLTISAWKADFPDPDGFFRGLNQGGGWPFYRDDEIAALLDDARSVRDQTERIRLYQEIDRLWVTERTTILPLAYGRRIILRRPWVQGVWASPLSRPHYERVVVEREPADTEEPAGQLEIGGVPGH